MWPSHVTVQNCWYARISVAEFLSFAGICMQTVSNNKLLLLWEKNCTSITNVYFWYWLRRWYTTTVWVCIPHSALRKRVSFSEIGVQWVGVTEGYCRLGGLCFLRGWLEYYFVIVPFTRYQQNIMRYYRKQYKAYNWKIYHCALVLWVPLLRVICCSNIYSDCQVMHFCRGEANLKLLWF